MDTLLSNISTFFPFTTKLYVIREIQKRQKCKVQHERTITLYLQKFEATYIQHDEYFTLTKAEVFLDSSDWPS